MTTAAADGTYTIAGLPFGSYFVTAIPRVPLEGRDAWQDPELLDSLVSRAKQPTLQEGERQVANIRLASR